MDKETNEYMTEIVNETVLYVIYAVAIYAVVLSVYWIFID
jgi:hypothetical protein